MNLPTSPPRRATRRVDPRFLKNGGIVGLTGNELLVKGALEAGAALLTGYPGSPISGVFETIESIAPYLEEIGVVAQIANNEALAAARLSGACQAGVRAIAVMKSVGFHVAADALATGNLVEFRRPEAGGLVVTGDDPWNESTQVNSDSRFLSMHLNMPVIEPGSLQEIKDWVGAGLELSGAADLLVTLVITTNQADGGGTVIASPNRRPQVNAAERSHFVSTAVATGDVIMIPPFITQREATLAERARRLHARARELRLDRRFGPPGRSPVGFVASGLSAAYLKRVLQLAGLWGAIPVLRLGLTYPIDADALVSFAAGIERIIVVEEKRGFVEAQVLQVLTAAVRSGELAALPEIWGKQFPGGRPGFPSVGGLNPSVVLEVLGPDLLSWGNWFPSLERARVVDRLAQVKATGAPTAALPARTPTFCPGCPHRDTAVVARDLKRRLRSDAGASSLSRLDVVVHGESGCHTMLGFPPFAELMQNYVGMGLGGGAGAGMGPFVDNPHVVFMGDSTFFHSGLVAISDSIKHDLDVTYVILENGTTAMTGHQPTAENRRDIMGRPTRTQDIERILRGMVPEGLTLRRLDPARRNAYAQLLEECVRSPGVKVVIADKECAITAHRRESAERKRRIAERGFLEREQRIAIDEEVCDYCLECVDQTACPGLAVVGTALGPRIGTDLSTCVDDGACARTSACPSFARLTIRRRSAPVSASKEKEAAPSPLPPPPIEPGLEAGSSWSAYLGGVGGMGIGVLTGIVARAGEFDGYHAHFVTRNGLAIRNGGVYGHLVLSDGEPPDSPFEFYGDADLLIGVDLLEACRGVHPGGHLRVAHRERTRAVVNLGMQQTVNSQAGREVLDARALVALLRGRIRDDAGVFSDFSRVAERELGSRVFANVMMLGVAFQKGWLPLTEASLLRSIEDNVRAADRAANLRAFRVGRSLALAPSEELQAAPAEEDYAQAVEARAGLIQRERGGGERAADAYRDLATRAGAALPLPEKDRLYVAYALADLVRYGGTGLAERYLAHVAAVLARDGHERAYRATRTALRSFLTLMTPKDEFWVARLLTSPDKVERDRRRYGVDPARGDSIDYAFLVRPRLSLFGRSVEFPVAARPWMLRLIASASFLRNWGRGWNRDDDEFLAWFAAQVERAGRDADDSRLVEVLERGAEVRGFRDIRRRRREAARVAIATLLGTPAARPAAERLAQRDADFTPGTAT